MIPEKANLVRFPAKINTVYNKLLPTNDLVFQFLIKHLHICSYKFSYRKSDPEICSAMLCKFCNFSPIFSYLNADLTIQKKNPILIYVCKVVTSGYKDYAICISYQLRPIWAYFRHRLVSSDICFSI